ncbi:MAG: PEP-CTERM sorting domain-containing protein [Pirellulales bacterium]|nr:PEP-CTERM sorting domain-containing protein [Pirellulales bacterium]
MMKRLSLSLSLTVATSVVLIVGGRAAADVIVDQDTTIDYGVASLIRVVDGASPPTVLDIVPGGSAPYVSSEGSSIVNVDGGLVSNGVPSAVGITAVDSSVVNVLGGSVECEDWSIHAYGTSEINISGGVVSVIEDIAVTAYGQSEVNVTGGEIVSDDFRGVAARDSSVVNVSGGIFNTDNEAVFAYDAGKVNVFGGTLNQAAGASGTGVLNIFGGTIGDVSPTGLGICAEEAARVRVSGGTIRGRLLAVDSSIVTIVGYDLDLTGTLLTGTLADGTPLNHEAVAVDSGRFVLQNVPEPSSLVLALMGAAAGGLLGWRRRVGPNK